MTFDTINDAVTMQPGAAGTLLAGRYRIVRQLGQGGMGSVWLAGDTQLDGKLFAIKMLPSILMSDKRAYRQLKDEALVAMKLTHPNIVTLRAFEENNGNPFLVMDYIDGETLDDYLAEHCGDVLTQRRRDAEDGRAASTRPPSGGLPEEEVIRLLKPIAAALDYAHGEGVVHRDVKPANVMIRKDGHPYILDFGIAREIQETMTRATGKLSSGTLRYMSPEQLNGEPPKPAQDVYSFAAMVYECLKGEPPFVRGAIEDQIRNKTPEPLGGTSFGASVMAGLAKNPEDRSKTCAAVLKGVGTCISESWPGKKEIGDIKPSDSKLCKSVTRRVDPDVPQVDEQGNGCVHKHGGMLRSLMVIALLALLIVCGWAWVKNVKVGICPVPARDDVSADKLPVIMFLVDVSGSMDALDMTPNPSNGVTRLDVVKRVLADYVTAHPSVKFGLVSFAGEVNVHAKYGTSQAELLRRIASLDVPKVKFDANGRAHDSNTAMTAIGDGLSVAISELCNVADGSERVVVLLSDGVSNAGKSSVVDAADIACLDKIRISTIAIGTMSKRTPIKGQDFFGREQILFTDTAFDAEQLKMIATATGGRFAFGTSEKSLRCALNEVTTSLNGKPFCRDVLEKARSGTKSSGGDLFSQMEEMQKQFKGVDRFFSCRVIPSLYMSKSPVMVGEDFEFVVTFDAPKDVSIGEVKMTPSHAEGMVVRGAAENMPDECSSNPSNVLRRIKIPVRYDAPFTGKIAFTIEGYLRKRFNENGKSMVVSNSFREETAPVRVEVYRHQ